MFTAGHSVWLTWEATAPEVVTIETCDSEFPTSLVVFIAPVSRKPAQNTGAKHWSLSMRGSELRPAGQRPLATLPLPVGKRA